MLWLLLLLLFVFYSNINIYCKFFKKKIICNNILTEALQNIQFLKCCVIQQRYDSISSKIEPLWFLINLKFQGVKIRLEE